MQNVVMRLTYAEVTPGLWMAPLAADPASALVAAHDDWWVTDDAGVPLLADGFYVLDITQTAAAAYLLDTMQKKAAEGWRLFVLDLGVGAVEGNRSAAITGTSAYRHALELVRSAAPEAWITAVDAPLLPSVGLVDAFRGGTESVLRRGLADTVWRADAGAIPADTEPTDASYVAALVGRASVSVQGPLPAPPNDAIVDLWTLDLGTAADPVDALSATGVPFCWTFDDTCNAVLNPADTPAVGACDDEVDVELAPDSGGLLGCESTAP
jgi:hypothetical protein